jgi:PleD family two-component response regulator
MEQQRRKIMYVDDVIYSLMTVKDRLKAHYEIFPAQTVEKMFEVLENVRIELILLDVNMPEVDGYEAIRQLKADDRYFDIPVVFLSSSDNKKSVKMGMDLGAADFVTKPFNDDEMIARIERLLSPETSEEDKPIILAVDDNPSILRSLNYLLNSRYTVYTLPDPQKITEILKLVAPDLFILDFNMPGLNGFDLFPIIRGYAEHEHTPIIMLTTEGTIDNITVAANVGASDFIVKPIDETIMLDKVAHALKNYVTNRLLWRLRE